MPPIIQASIPEMSPCSIKEQPHWLTDISVRSGLHPLRPAVLGNSSSINYGELECRSNQIASMLATQGIGPGHFVGAAFHRSSELITALLGILKSGAAYIPIDPSYPAERISRMISSAAIQTILTDDPSHSSLVGTTTLSTHSARKTDPYFVRKTPSPNDAIYAIFTSGSTGLPKAASVLHSGFCNLLEWYTTELSLGPDDRTLVISSPSFDLTQKNLFAPLITGGMLVLDDLPTYDITRILELIRTHEVTLVNCTPSAFYPLVDAAEANGFEALSSLRFAVLGGEPISVPRLRRWLEHPSCSAEVVNSYGPTECTDICLFHRLHRGNLDDFAFVPLGREIPNVSVAILDDDLRPLPDGQTGELCISGTGVGSGYLNDPQRTATRFIGGIYRTGDLARRLPCGTFEFRGRADHQVKVNGHRIELGEIETAISSHPGVREAVVTATTTQLTAHIQGSATTNSLRDHLSRTLPAYMVPSEFIFHESFPLTPNGKVDRKKLEAPATPESKTSLPAPDTGSLSFENRILAIWSDVLARQVTDPTANFFDVGGSSIHLAIVHVRLREMTGSDFPITELFALPSARSIARHLSSDQESPDPNPSLNRARLAKNGFARFQRPLQNR